MTRLIYLVDNICLMNRIGDSGEGSARNIKESNWKQVGLSSDTEEQILQEIKQKLEQSEVILSIGGDENQKTGE